MKKKLLSFVLLVLFLVSCSKVPITKRKQINLLPESEMMSMSLTSYREFLSQHPPVNGSSEAGMVKNVGAKISASVTRYMNQNGYAKRVQGYQWEFNLVNSNEANAWCMPGGKVVVYSGLLPITQDESSLAIVMGHEVAHAVARHGNERMSQMMVSTLGGMALDVALSQKSAETRSIFLTAYGAGSALGTLAYSRTHETEADKLGLIFAAMAGYDPQKAIVFWERMASKGGAKPPELLSTHPSDQTRIKNLKEFMPTALSYYHPGTK
ncbi:MAG: M48 family metallopeptidase [Bacteroidetes bacterium]|nr:M48 family metallopeptidase [Bacteroidota bacterium]MBK9526530.1 M48 family metallopeptidase [Bacteroidota bacterium]MBK9542782.1 M48 family metallopeptidase [Bacteroidota bacterium]MBL0256949.1 M48 family metallopeptidase [Bacteroidota bacterium]